jgi:two-component system CheB/CheR fusion protein
LTEVKENPAMDTLIENWPLIEAQLREKDRQLRQILDNSAALIFLKDSAGRYQVVNNDFEKVLQRPQDEVLGKTDDDLFPPDIAAALRRHDHVVLREGGTMEFEELLPHVDGLHTYLVTKFPIHGPDGEIVAVGGIKTDVTQMKRAEKRACEAVQQRDRFLAMLSHELRNPLGALLNASRVIKRSRETGTPPAEALDVIERQSNQMARLLDDLFDVSRVSQGKIDLRLAPLDLRSLCGDALETAGPAADSHGHRLELDICDEALPVNADRARLLQVLENLLANAVKYTPDGGQIVLSMQRDKGRAVIKVRDTGRGIPANMLDSIFDLFMQSGETIDRSDGGMGIGLTLARELVRRHGGTVVAHSEGLEKGSEFVVRLPLTQTALPDTTPATIPVSARPSKTIVVIEDEEDGRNMLTELLRLDGLDVVAEADGEAGLATICRTRPDIALVDIGLPNLDGYQVARRVREQLKSHRVKLVALTGYGRAEDHRAIMAAGFDDHLVKPLNMEDLDRVLARPT